MTWEAWLTLAVVVATVGSLVTERVSPPYAVLGAVTVLLVTGVIDSDQAFVGFSNPAPITVAALYVLAAAVEKTGALEVVTARILGTSGPGDGGDVRTLSRVIVPTAAASTFLNNTPIVAMVAPGVIAWARRSGRSPSRYLMPVSFAAILGGLVTLIGTSTNLVVSGLMESSGMDGMGLFEIGKVGLPIAIVGLALMVFLTSKLLPVRRSPGEDFGSDAREFTVEMLVGAEGALEGQTVSDAGLRNLEGVFLIEIERDGRRVTPVGPREVLAAGDRLVFAGNVERVVDLQRIPGLVSAEEQHFPAAVQERLRRFYEVVVAEDSPLAHSTLKDAGFRGRYGGAVLAIHRAGHRIPGKLGEVPIRPGDVLLVLAGDRFRQRWRDERDFLVVAPLDGDAPPRRSKAPIVAAITLAVLLLAGTGLMDILEVSLLAAVALVGLRVLTAQEARNSVDLNVIVVIAGSFGLGEAISSSGLAQEVADKIVSPLGHFGDIGLLVGVLVATTLLTELITNNAAAVLMFPIALAVATNAGLDPRGFAIAVAVGASASFLSPIGYQTNTMVYGMGGYRFGDFFRLGFPLTILAFVTASILIPVFWPF